MKRQKKIYSYLFLCVIIIFWGTHVMGEDLTAEQKEVWAAVQAVWENIKNGDINNALAGQHDKMLVWFCMNPDPSGKDLIRAEYKTWVYRYMPTYIKLEPLAINIVKDVATVFYLFKWESANREVSDRGRELITLVKQNNKWLAIGSLASSCNNLSPCPYRW